MREKQKERRSERERETEGDGARACVCARASVLLRRVTGEYSFIKLDEEGARVRDRPAPPRRCRAGSVRVPPLVGSQVFFVSLSRSRQFRRRSRSFLSSPRVLFLSRSLVRACVRPYVRRSVQRPLFPLFPLFLSLCRSVNSTWGIFCADDPCRSLASRYIYPLL